MDQVQLCLFVVLAFSCLTQLVTPLPMIIDAELDYNTEVPVPITEDIYDLKDKADFFDPTSVLLTRFRRNTAQWMQASQHYNDNNRANNRRFAHLRNNNRNNGGGVIAEA